MWDIVFTADGQRLIAASLDGTIPVWRLEAPALPATDDLAAWEARACQVANRNLAEAEWQSYLPQEAYRLLCPGLAASSPLATTVETGLLLLTMAGKEEVKGEGMANFVPADAGMVLHNGDELRLEPGVTTWLLCEDMTVLKVPAEIYPIGSHCVSPRDDVNLLTAVRGQVQVKRQNWTDFMPASPGMILHRGDLLFVPEAGQAQLLCENGRSQEVPANITQDVRDICPEGVNNLGHLKDASRGTRGDTDLLIPYLISPRMTHLLTRQPTLRWHETPGTTTYSVQIAGLDWKEETNAAELIYAGNPPLQEETVYLLIVENDDARSSREEGTPGLGFLLLPAAEAAIVQETRANIIALNLSPEWEALAIAHLYIKYDLLVEAIDVLTTSLQAGPQTAAAYRLLGALYQHIGLPLLAESQYLQAIPLAENINDIEGLASGQAGLGDVYLDLGNRLEATRWLESARKSYEILGDAQQTEDLTKRIFGLLYLYQARYSEAFTYFQRTYNIAMALEDVVEQESALHNLGLVYYGQGRFEEALTTFAQSLSSAEKSGRKEDVIATLNNMALAYDDTDRNEEALAHYASALTLATEIGNQDHVANILSNMGAVYLELGRATEAAKVLQQSITISRQTGNWLFLAGALNNLGAAYEEQGNQSLALAYYNEALQIVQAAENGERQGAVLSNIGQIYEFLGDPQQALSYYEQAMEAFENVRANAGSDIGRSAFIDRRIDLYTHAADLYFQQGRFEEAFFTSERGRARSFLDSLVTNSVQLTDNEAAALLAQETLAYINWQALQSHLATIRLASEADKTDIQILETEVAAAEATYTAALARVEQENEALAALISMRDMVPTLTEIQAVLSEGTTLLSYFVVSTHKTLAFVLTHNSFAVKALDLGSQDLTNIVDELVNTEIMGGYKLLPNAYTDTAQFLYSRLITPLRSEIHTEHLIIVPHGQLHYVPYAALLNGEKALIDEFVLSFLPSAGTLPMLPEKAEDAQGISALVLGNPVATISLPDLPAAEIEAEAIAALYGVDAALNGDAKESLVKKQAGNAGILHLAVHGRYEAQNPLATTLYLAEDDANDGRLQVSEVFGLPLIDTRRQYPHPYYWAGFVLTGDGDKEGGILPAATTYEQEATTTLVVASTPAPTPQATVAVIETENEPSNASHIGVYAAIALLLGLALLLGIKRKKDR